MSVGMHGKVAAELSPGAYSGIDVWARWRCERVEIIDFDRTGGSGSRLVARQRA